MKGIKGFVDLQANGFMGVDFSAPGLTVAQVENVTLGLVSRGTVAYYPTVITTGQEVYKENLGVIAGAMRDPEWGGHILGIHMEGPFISPEDGAVGAHPKGYIRDPNITLFEQFQNWAGGLIDILTLAPEMPGALDLIRHAVAHGVIVSLGHHLASKADIDAAVAAGAQLCTHLGNGLPNQIHRHENQLWRQLVCDELSASFITDGHHLPADFIKVALRAKTLDRFVVVSDASPLAGMPPGFYDLFGKQVEVQSSGAIWCEETGGFAGSHATMFECMNYLASLGLLTEDELWQVGLVNPLRILGMKPDDIAALNGSEFVFKNNRFTLK